MFIDRIKLDLRAGKGGNGVVAWIRRKYVPKGGPSGGDGGKGGDVFFKVDSSLNSLEWFWNRGELAAENGVNGGANRRQGRRGNDLVLKVPPGTQVYDSETDELIVDLVEESEPFMICRGGRGGYGNDHFKSSTNRAPTQWTPGKAGAERQVRLELKLIADVGLVGFPNAGKSTLISSLTHVRVKIASYPFTTLTPNLGYIKFEDYSKVLIADIPGLIQGAHNNRGLGIQFLKHIERTRALVYVLDASGIDGRTPWEDWITLKSELKAYDPQLLERPFFVLLNKIDSELAEEHIKSFKENWGENRSNLFEVSALDEIGLDQVTDSLHKFSTMDKKNFS